MILTAQQTIRNIALKSLRPFCHYDLCQITFLLKEKSFNPDHSQCGEDCRSDDLPRLQVSAVGVDLSPALLHVQQDHLLVHLQGTLYKDTLQDLNFHSHATEQNKMWQALTKS